MNRKNAKKEVKSTPVRVAVVIIIVIIVAVENIIKGMHQR